MIKGIIFDYGNVIARVDNNKFLQRLAERSPLPVRELEHIIYHNPNISREFESGRITSAEFYEQVTQLGNVSMSEAEFKTAFTDIFERIPGTLSLIRYLKPRYRIGLLSNTNPLDFDAEIAKVEVFPLFDAVTVSFRLGVMKPDPRIYLEAVGKLGLSPAQCIYIDDIPSYVDGARVCGLHAIHYTSHSSLVEALSVSGIPVRESELD